MTWYRRKSQNCRTIKEKTLKITKSNGSHLGQKHPVFIFLYMTSQELETTYSFVLLYTLAFFSFSDQNLENQYVDSRGRMVTALIVWQDL